LSYWKRGTEAGKNVTNAKKLGGNFFIKSVFIHEKQKSKTFFSFANRRCQIIPVMQNNGTKKATLFFYGHFSHRQIL
jgi:hypothetical protein